MKSKIIRIFAFLVMSSAATSCSFLDVSDELAGGISDIDQVFNNVDRTKKWYGQCFNNVPDMSRMWGESGIGMGNQWAFMADELYSRQANKIGRYGGWNSSNTRMSRYSTLYESIRQCNIFLERAKPIIDDSPDADRLTEPEVERYKANIRFMRAAYYYFLMEVFGPVPIITQSFDLSDNLDLPRDPLDKLIEFIDTELKECMDGMEPEPYHTNINYRAVPTKGTAMALRAKLWVFAASPLFNGGYAEALAVTNPDGTRLFPDRDASKWNKAVQYCREFLDYAEQGNRYYLYKSASNDPNLSVYELFQEYNPEMIWATAKSEWGSLGDQNFESMITPRSEPNGLAGMHLLQELVDDFYMADGLPIKSTSFLPASPTYSETGFGTHDGFEVFNMYVGREPRFYNTVTFSGKKWHISGNEIQLYIGGNADRDATDGIPWSGYYLYKRANRTVHGNSPGVRSFFRPPIIFRLAEFYLLYAEALNEVDPSHPDILKYVNLVRERAGLPDLEALNPAIAGDQQLQREAIRRESRVELCTEGQRYFDVRRWMIAENAPGEGGQGGDFTGMNIDGNKVTFHTRTRIQTRQFSRKEYLDPIPLQELQKTTQLVQNPGW